MYPAILEVTPIKKVVEKGNLLQNIYLQTYSTNSGYYIKESNLIIFKDKKIKKAIDGFNCGNKCL